MSCNTKLSLQGIVLIMFGKLTQFKNFIANAVTSLHSQRPTLPNDPDLDGKLKFMLDHILRNPPEAQFKAYHSLQAPQMTLNQLLSQIYHSQTADTAQIASILHFYTFLLINCNNELVVCKIVSDSFVVQLTEVYLDALARNLVNNNIQIEQVNSYKIALIKAYVSRIDGETIKYMILNDRMRVLQNCVHLYEQYMRVQGQEQFGVEATCISNCILMIIRYLGEHPQYSTSICYQDEKKGVGYLLVLIVERVHRSMVVMLHEAGMDEERFQFLKDRILFLIDIVNSITSKEYKERIIAETSKELADLRQLFKQIVLEHTVVDNRSEQNYIKNIELIKALLKMMGIYFNSEALLPVFEETMLPILNKFIQVFKSGCSQIKIKQRQFDQQLFDELVDKTETLNITLCSLKNKIANLFCANMQTLALMITSGEYLSRRQSAKNKEKGHRHTKQQELKNIIINSLIDVVQILLSEEGCPIQDMLCFKSVKFMLLSLMQLTVGEHFLQEYSVLKFHQFAITKLKKSLKNSNGWDYVVLHYESLLKSVSQSLISIQDTSPLQYAFCQFHDPSRRRSPQQLDELINSLYINECARNFRFMMVERTTVGVKDIKLQKSYHINFISAGWGLEPGKQVGDGVFVEVCQLSHLSKGIKIPISVVEDEECLLFVHSEGEARRVIMNIRYKSIEGFTVEKEVMHIRLKGLQEVLVQPYGKNQKQNMAKFKNYLIHKRDKSRERELKFIHHYLQLYYQDNLKVIEEMGQAQIEGDDGLNSPERKKQLQINKQSNCMGKERVDLLQQKQQAKQSLQIQQQETSLNFQKQEPLKLQHSPLNTQIVENESLANQNQKQPVEECQNKQKQQTEPTTAQNIESVSSKLIDEKSNYMQGQSQLQHQQPQPVAGPSQMEAVKVQIDDKQQQNQPGIYQNQLYKTIVFQVVGQLPDEPDSTIKGQAHEIEARKQQLAEHRQQQIESKTNQAAKMQISKVYIQKNNNQVMPEALQRIQNEHLSTLSKINKISQPYNNQKSNDISPAQNQPQPNIPQPQKIAPENNLAPTEQNEVLKQNVEAVGGVQEGAQAIGEGEGVLAQKIDNL